MQPEPPVQFANGVRLFAYRALREQLTCGELNLALTEIDSAARAYQSPVAGLAADKQVRARSLCVEVSSELREETTTRCQTGLGSHQPANSGAATPL